MRVRLHGCARVQTHMRGRGRARAYACKCKCKCVCANVHVYACACARVGVWACPCVRVCVRACASFARAASSSRLSSFASRRACACAWYVYTWYVYTWYIHGTSIPISIHGTYTWYVFAVHGTCRETDRKVIATTHHRQRTPCVPLHARPCAMHVHE